MSIALFTTPTIGSFDKRRYLTPSSINSGPLLVLLGTLKAAQARRHAFSSDSLIGVDEVDLNIFRFSFVGRGLWVVGCLLHLLGGFHLRLFSILILEFMIAPF